MLNDLEAHNASMQGDASQHAQLHEAMFGSNNADGIANAVLFHFYSAQLNLLRETCFKPLPAFLQLCADQPSLEDLFGFCLTVSRIVRSLKDRQRSIGDIIGVLLKEHQHRIENVLSDILLTSRHAIFAILGIFTIMYKLPSKPATNHSEAIVHSTATETMALQHIDQSGRPMRALLQSAGASLSPKVTDSSASSFPVSTLNFSTLALRISGRGITIVWVDDLICAKYEEPMMPFSPQQ
ncbi:uncharacterized protein LY89DRAFT_784903 [Mollisia scopiformis]|uniref:Uncharacterized protein n=1 Tax=Mollisia scopiformis TaxID=149040 RepID=A0A194WZT9_MOLSC|nr:uncharacterized protein LY89DRAFT_784903 [Mollisia scopiformis]KUJ13137.1 hypothetical protein LY89DRAFT_784903 [Mollisia scopiformis]